MSRATDSELLTRKLNQFLTPEEYNDPITYKRVHEAFWVGVRAHYKLKQNKQKKEAAKRLKEKRDNERKQDSEDRV